MTSDEQSKQLRPLDGDIRHMISALAQRLSPTSISASSIVTVAGDDDGARMRADGSEMRGTSGTMYSDEKTMRSITNSNFQAVNNSIMLRGKCVLVEEPRVPLVIMSDHLDDYDDRDDEP